MWTTTLVSTHLRCHKSRLLASLVRTKPQCSARTTLELLRRPVMPADPPPEVESSDAPLPVEVVLSVRPSAVLRTTTVSDVTLEATASTATVARRRGSCTLRGRM